MNPRRSASGRAHANDVPHAHVFMQTHRPPLRFP
ncbi:hypothetical protein DM75_2976 [Burkholderia mallei]|nr:hypothetical protein DM75_2976 [Burkholderia mallei]